MREQVRLGRLSTALIIANGRVAHDPSDLEAHGWRGRLLAWQGSWIEAESEYRYVLEHAPGDTDIMVGLVDVLFWQGKRSEALILVEQIRNIAPTRTDVLVRRAKILRSLNDSPQVLEQYREILKLQPDNREAKRATEELASNSRYELRTGADGSTFSDSGSAGSEALMLNARWSERISTSIQTSFSQRFGQSVTKLGGSSSVHVTHQSWLNVGGAAANANTIIPQHEAFLEYGQAFTSQNRLFKGLEISYQQHWLWYQSAHVLTLGVNQLYYLPRDWAWSLNLTGARSGFSGTGVEWVPSGSARLFLPLYRTLSGNVAFASGTENFAVIDQIGHFSARTFAGGLKYRYSNNQDISGYFAHQSRSQARTQNSFGMSYAFRF